MLEAPIDEARQMIAEIIDGKGRTELGGKIFEQVSEYVAKTPRTPGLAAMLVGTELWW